MVSSSKNFLENLPKDKFMDEKLTFNFDGMQIMMDHIHSI
jgi:hypothetical protein